jgi:hypothetical protein
MRTAILTLALLGLAACQMPPQTVTVSPTDPSGALRKPPEPAVLYARNGKPVDENATSRGASAKDGQASGGRLTILELYQKTLDERDALVRELEVVRAELDQTRRALDESQRRAEQLQQHSSADDQETQRLRAENLELAARLATAHIRRMEAEKELLETKLANAKALAQNDAKSADPKSEGKKP